MKHFSLWHLPSEWHQLNRAEQQRVMQSQKKKESERERQGEKHKWESKGKKEDRNGMNYSKEEESDRTRRAVPARHCFTSHCTEEESLSYASVFHIALTIYVPTRIMQLDGSVEKTLINLTLFLVFFPLFLFQCPSNPLSLCSLAFICSSLFPPSSYVKIFSSSIFCILLSLYSL